MTNKQIVLIIGNDISFSQILKQSIHNEFEVYKASTKMEGFAVLRAKRVEVTLLELCMPIDRGLGVLRDIKQTDFNSKVIILAEVSSHELAMECANLNVQGYFKKPVDISRLRERINRLTGIGDHKFLKALWGNEYQCKVSFLSHTVKGTMNYIECNCHRDFSRCDIAEYLNLAPDHVSKVFYRECGMQLKKYINLFRIHKIKELLSKPSRVKIKEIAESVGMQDASYFCRFFKKHTNLTPRKFRETFLLDLSKRT